MISISLACFPVPSLFQQLGFWIFFRFGPRSYPFFSFHSFIAFIMVLTKSLLLSFLASAAAAAGVTGKAFGFAAKATGGGDAKREFCNDASVLGFLLTND